MVSPRTEIGISPDRQRELGAMLAKTGWRAVPGPSGWRLNKPCQSEPIYAGSTAHWLALHSLPEQRIPLTNTADDRAVFRKLLQLNDGRLFGTKFGLDASAHLTLSAELPAASLDPIILGTTIEAMAHYRSAGFLREALNDPLTPRLAPKSSAVPPTVVSFEPFVRSLAPDRWWPQEKPFGDTWQLAYFGARRKFDAFFSLGQSWACFRAFPLVQAEPAVLAEGDIAQAVFLRYLLRLSGEFYLAKLGLDEKGRVVLLVEVPSAELDFTLFSWVLRTIGRYLEEWSRELEVAARPEQSALIIDLMARAAGYENGGGTHG